MHTISNLISRRCFLGALTAGSAGLAAPRVGVLARLNVDLGLPRELAASKNIPERYAKQVGAPERAPQGRAVGDYPQRLRLTRGDERKKKGRR